MEVDENDPNYLENFYKPSGADGRGWGKWRNLTEEEEKAF
jgi:hypothetical protein